MRLIPPGGARVSKGTEDLKRLKLTKLGKAWVKSQAHGDKRSEQEVVRDAIHQLALKDFRKARVFVALAPAEDLSGDDEGQA